ncbi:MAG: efflux RND transporter periplasmic adaptor subunit [Verrucomicrobiales bacterium]
MKLRLIFLTALLPASCNKPAPPVIKPAPPVPVQTVTLEKGDIQRWLTRPAEVRALQQAVLYAKITGYLKSVAVDEGDAVKAGQVLAEIEVPELESEGAKCRAELNAARVEYDRLESGRKKSPDLITPQAVDAAKARFDIAKAALQRHETQVGFTHITAPFDGVVTKRWADPGAFIAAATASSHPETSALLTVMDFSTVRVEAAIPEPDVPFVKDGNAVTLQSASLPGETLRGKVTRFAHALDDMTRSMNAQIELPNPGGKLRPGMFVEARIALEERQGVPLIPAEALITEKLKTSVFLAVDGKAKKTVVKAGFGDGAKVEILEGIKPGDAVVLAGKLSLSDGQSIAAQPKGTTP